MKRSELLKQNLNEDKSKELAVNKAIKADEKFVNRSIQSITNTIEDLKEKLDSRLSADAPLDSSVVEVTFKSIKEQEAKLAIYKEFKESYIG